MPDNLFKKLEMKDELLISYLLGETRDDETSQVRQWIAAAPSHQQHFEQLSLIWESSKNLGLTGTANAHASLDRFKQKHARNNTHPKVASLRFFWLKVAAVLAVVFTAAWLLYQQSVKKPDNLSALNQIKTIGAVKADTLPDGSVVTLNKNTAFARPQQFLGNVRKVELKDGEAFFDITPDKAKPFIITVSGTTVKVVGTSFNIKTRSGRTEVIVETGVVQVTKGGRVITLRPGEKTLIYTDSKALTKVKNPDLLYQYYRTKQFIADDTPLWRMVEVLNEAYNSHITISNQALRNLPLNSVFNDESLDHILVVINKTFPAIKIVRKGDQIILK
jgi:transmembrane sensor